MKFEYQQVCLELSKELKKADYPQEGRWWWTKSNNKYELWSGEGIEQLFDSSKLWVAPTVAELGEALPSYIFQRAIGEGEHGGKYYLYTQKESGRGWTCFYAINNGQTRLYRVEATTEADARAKMWLYLKKEGLL